MTLCILYKDNANNIHIASDSRLTMASNSFADVGIKVISVPYRIYHPSSEGKTELAYEGELGMCYAGSTLNALILKESIMEVLKNLQFIPDETQITLENIAKIVFKAYKNISSKITETAVGKNGIAEIYLAGKLFHDTTYKAFQFKTDQYNQHSCNEVLTNQNYILAGSGKTRAEKYLETIGSETTLLDLMNSLKETIEDKTIDDVDGAIQYGKFIQNKFVTYGIAQFNQDSGDIHYFRSSLDLNSSEFTAKYGEFFLSYQFIDPFDTFKNDF